MHTITFDFSSQEITPDVFGYNVRLGYILSTKHSCNGSSGLRIEFYNYYNKLTILQRAKLIYGSEKTSEDFKKVIAQFLDLDKEIKKIKHPGKDILVIMNKSQRDLEKVLKLWSETIEIDIQTGNFEGFQSIKDEGVFEVNKKINEYKNGEDSFAFSKDVLTFKISQNAGREGIWIVPVQFYEPNIFDEEVITNANDIVPNKPYLINCGQVPSLTRLSVCELNAVKIQLHQILEPFREAAHNWSISCYNGGGYEVFKNNVLPHCNELKTALQENMILNFCDKQLKGLGNNQLFIGEVTPPIFWKYYQYFYYLSEENYNEITEAYKKETPYTIPIIMVSSHKQLDLKLSIRNEAAVIETIAPVKKSINFD